MSRSILVPIDDSPPSTAALEYALSNHADDEITVLHVVDVTDSAAFGADGYYPVDFDADDEHATDLMDEVRRLAEDAGVAVSTTVERGAPARRINDYVDEHGIEQIIMGSHGRRGVKRLIFGSVAEQVVRRAPVPVTVVR